MVSRLVLSKHNRQTYEKIALKWEQLPALLPPSFKKEEYWSEDGCKKEALILMKNYHFDRTLQ